MQVSYNGKAVRTRRLFRFTESGSRVVFGVHNNSVSNIKRALDERVYNSVQDGELKPTPQPLSEEFFCEQFMPFQEALLKNLPVLQPLSDDQFVDRYSGRKRARYQKAVESLRIGGVTWSDSHIRAFIKSEKLNLTNKADPCPRIIQPRDPRFNVSLGKYIAHCEKPLFKAIAKVFGATTVFKGLDVVEGAKELRKHWDHFNDPVAVSTDFSRFDQHVSVPALKEEHKMWPRMVPTPDRKKLSALLRMQLTTKGRALCDDGIVKYEVDGCRMSGDMNTSSGNCFIACGLIYAYMAARGIGKYRLANNGDDCVIMMERKDLSKFTQDIKEWFMNMGFAMVNEEPVDVFEQIEFCQCRAVLTSAGWRFVRNPHTSLAKDATANCDISNAKVCEAWLSAVGEGGAALTDGVPVLQEFYRQFPSGGRKIHEQCLAGYWASGMNHLVGDLNFNNIPVDATARFSFWLAFGILPDEQKCLEELFSKNVFRFSKPTREANLDGLSIIDGKNPKLLPIN